MKYIILTILMATVQNVMAQFPTDIQLFSRMNGGILLDDGHVTEYWGFGSFAGPQVSPLDQISIPGPILQFSVGDTVSIVFYNDSPEDHSIHWHGLDVDQANDGVPTTSSAIDPQESRTYTFVCTHAGTFNYHCHVLTTLHLSMGMYGSLVVYPAENQYQIYSNGPSYTKEYIWLASELNRTWTDNPTSPGSFHLYEPTDFLLNGKSGSQLSNTAVVGNEDDTLAMRLSNMGYGKVVYKFPQGSNPELHMSDGRMIPQTIFSDSVEVYSGERYTVLLNPDQDITDNIEIKYYDLRNNELLHTNYVAMEINDSYTGIKEEKSSSLAIMGNPIEGKTLVLNSDKVQVVQLYDTKGRKVKEMSIQNGVNVIPLDLTTGFYFLITEEKESLKLIVR